MKQNNQIKESIDLSELTQRLKKEDKQYSNLSKRVQIIYWVLIPIYLAMVVLHFFEDARIDDIIGSTCFMLAMLIFALFFRYYYKKYKHVDYSQPTLTMLKKAAYRYQPFQLESLWLLLALVLIDVGLCLNHSLNFDVIQVQIYFIGTLIVAILIGFLVWYVRYKPIRDAALALIREIEKDE
jgi:H+/gluconate symporter-like permease